MIIWRQTTYHDNSTGQKRQTLSFIHLAETIVIHKAETCGYMGMFTLLTNHDCSEGQLGSDDVIYPDSC